MEKKMLDAGGAEKRRELYAKVNAKVITAAFESMVLSEGVYSASDAKIAKDGDIGQGESLAEQKARQQQRKVQATPKK